MVSDFGNKDSYFFVCSFNKSRFSVNKTSFLNFIFDFMCEYKNYFLFLQ